VEGAKHFVVLNVKGASGLELSAEVQLHGGLDSGLLLELLRPHLLLFVAVMVASGPCGPSRATGMVRVLGVQVGMSRMLLCTVVETRHDGMQSRAAEMLERERQREVVVGESCWEIAEEGR